MINFYTTPERYEIKEWSVQKDGKKITDVSMLSSGDLVKFAVSFKNLMIDKECVLIIRSYSAEKQNGLLAQEVTIFPDVLPFDLMSENFEIKDKTDRIDVALYKDFESVTKEEEDLFLIGKNIHGIKPAKLNINKNGFTKITEASSENPSLYIGNYEPCKEFFKGTVCFAQDSEYLWILDGKYCAKDIVIRKDSLLIPLTTAEMLFGRQFSGENGYIYIENLAKELGAYSYTNRFGLGVISDLPYDYSETMYQKHGQFMMRLIEFERPKAQELKKLYKGGSRPRSLGSVDELQHALNLTENDERAKYVSDKLFERADKFMDVQVQYKLDRGRAESAFITAIIDYDDILALIWAYKKSNDKKYLTRVKEHVLAMAGLENWCGDHFFLMTARALVSLAMAYDFLYDDFTLEERKTLAEAMVEKGFKPAMELYYGKADEACWPWCIRRTNWNFIPNSGIIFAAATIFDEYETDICADVIEKAIQSLEYAAIYLAPDGELYEGLAYAAYSWNYLVFAFQALNNKFGKAFGLDTTAGSQYSYKIPFQLMSSTGIYSTGDCGKSLHLNTFYTMWSAKKFKDHNIQPMRHMQMQNCSLCKAAFTDILWFDENAKDTPEFELDNYFKSTQSAISRSGWAYDDALLFIHAGDNSLEHGHFDFGNFNYEIDGFRFAEEIGMDSEIYCAPGSRYMIGGGDDYYVMRAEGHNVYVINPDRSVGQSSIAKADINVLKLDKDCARYMIDMEPAYRGQVKEAKRYFELSQQRSVFTVQDEITPMKSGDKVYWYWHTFAHIGFTDPVAVESNDNKVILTAPNGKKLYLEIECNVPFVLRKGVSIPAETSPSPFDQLQGGIISNLLTVFFETGEEKITLKVTSRRETQNSSKKQVVFNI